MIWIIIWVLILLVHTVQFIELDRCGSKFKYMSLFFMMLMVFCIGIKMGEILL